MEEETKMTNKELAHLATYLVKLSIVKPKLENECLNLYLEATGLINEPAEEDFPSHEDYVNYLIAEIEAEGMREDYAKAHAEQN